MISRTGSLTLKAMHEALKVKNIPIRNFGNPVSETAVSDRFSIREVVDLLAGKTLIQPLHRHDFFLIMVFEKGKGTHEIDFEEYEICDNSIFFIRPGQVHKLTIQAESSGYLIQFPKDFLQGTALPVNQILRKSAGVNFRVTDTERVLKLRSVLKYISDELNSKKQDYQEIIKLNLLIFLMEAGRLGDEKTHTASDFARERLEDFMGFLETHITSLKQVADYAALLNISTYQLNAVTKTRLGKTCSELINAYIILEAKRYLLATTNQVNQIAYQLGYEDVSYFIRFFKKQTGYSPESFRQNFK